MPKDQPDLVLSVIIVSYNTADLTLQAVKSCIKDINSSQLLTDHSEIIVVDNHSTDDSYKQLLKLKKGCSYLSILRNDENLGFSQANNLGIKQSRGQYILLLNSDTKVQADSLSQLVTSMEHYPVNSSTAQLSSHKGVLDHLGILAATLLNPDGTLQPQGGSLPSLFSLAVHMFFLDDLPILGKLLPTIQETGRAARYLNSNRTEPIQKDWVGGAAMLIRRQLIEEIGLLDPNIFMYGEDLEYCLRAKHRHWDIAIDPQAKVVHYGSASSSSENALLGEYKTLIYIWAKHKPGWQMYPAKTLLFFGAILRIILFGTILKNKAKAQVYKKALTLLD